MSALTRPIIGIENRTAQEVFDIMCDRFRAFSPNIGEVEVRELGWPPEISRGRRVGSQGGLIAYTMAYYGGTEWGDKTIYRWAMQGLSWSEPFYFYDEAKAAAQADYAQRIRSALVPSPQQHSSQADAPGIPATGSGETVPDGWKLVPVKPTTEMIAAVRKNGGMQAAAFAIAAWPDMLAASPANPAETQAVEVGK